MSSFRNLLLSLLLSLLLYISFLFIISFSLKSFIWKFSIGFSVSEFRLIKKGSSFKIFSISSLDNSLSFFNFLGSYFLGVLEDVLLFSISSQFVFFVGISFPEKDSSELLSDEDSYN